MKKIIVVFIAVIALIAVSYVGASYVCGIMTERQINEFVYSSAIPDNIRITDHRYDRGVFSSTVSTDVELAVPPYADPSKKLSLKLKTLIKHGPWPFGQTATGYTCTKPALAVIETTFAPTAGAADEIQQAFNKIFSRASMLNRTVINLSRDGESTFTIDAFADKFGENKEDTITWEGLKSHMSFSSGFKEVKGTITMPKLDVRATNGNLTMKDVRGSVDLHKVAENFYLGTSSFTVALLEFVNADTEKLQCFRMKTLRANSSSQESGPTMSSRNTLDIASVVVDDTTIGPIHLNLEFGNFDVPSMIKLSKSFRDLQKTAGDNSTQAMNSLIAQSYLDMLPDLLRSSPRIEMKDLSVKTNKGDVSGNLSIVCDGTKINANFNPFMIISALSASLEFAVTPDLLVETITFAKKEQLKDVQGQSISPDEIDAWAQAESKQQINYMIDRNILVQTDGLLSLKARYENGVVLINGQPIPLVNLLQKQRL